MKTINQLVTESSKKTYLSKLEALSLSIPYAFWKEYKTLEGFDDFFKGLDDADIKALDRLNDTVDDSKIKYSDLARASKEDGKNVFCDLCDLFISSKMNLFGPNKKADDKIFAEIKKNIEAFM